ncbi:sushi domain-containing protein 3 isoform X1 [Oryzias latipes]|uniref:Sushi domain-containing protein n=1 Tax=Oryzias latipes TaxID=8090 RepID=A0A3B3IFY6_ORYLA|nr:sushi domain-containing protein 3 isoform X1 [Oryzias latipes]XP_011475589.1 sushi domain-containing protein 3 isoform X1 [Oryzias latipes]
MAASVADGHRTDFTSKDGIGVWNSSGHPQAQCKPMHLTALGTQRIIQGNGTNVGTVISLQCPAKHKLMGKELTCVMDRNGTHWVGLEPFCKPLTPFEEHGFRIAVLVSIVSSGIILLMSLAFLTCCLLDCMKEDKKKQQKRELDAWPQEEELQHQENNRIQDCHKGRNNNSNNNAQEKMLSVRDAINPSLGINMQPCRYHNQYVYGPEACTCGPSPPFAQLPGHVYTQLLSSENQELCPPSYSGPSLACGMPTSSSLSQVPAYGSAMEWQYGEHHRSFSELIPPSTSGSDLRNTNSNVKPNQLSIRIISV